MKRLFSNLLLPVLLSACAVDTPVVKNDDRLEQDLGAWCQSACEKFDGCGLLDGPDELERCPTNCVDSFTREFVGRNEICSAAARRVMDCFDAASCADLSLDSACNFDAEADRCALSQGRVTCRSQSEGSGGGAGVAGSAGYAGSAGNFCELEFGDCNDDRTYRLSCMNPEAPECQCFVDDGLTKTFTPARLECLDPSEAIELCEWPIVAPDGADDSGGASVTIQCATIDTGGSAASCSSTFQNCSTGHTYSLVCAGAPGDAQCSCQIDGVTVGSAASAGDVCPYIEDPDGAILTIHEVCGLDIAAL
jgi:hypothetical protein